MEAEAIDGIFPDNLEPNNDEPDIEWPNIRQRRILIYGVTGSGKTTMAKWMSERTGIPWVEIDNLMWNANWEFVPIEEQQARIRAICDQDEWIMDAAYGKWIEIPLERVQLVIGLDYPRYRSFWQLLKRSVARGIDKKPVCNGNVETMRALFSKDSILLWHCKSYKSKQRRMRNWKTNQSQFDVLLPKKPISQERWEMERLVEAMMKREDEFN